MPVVLPVGQPSGRPRRGRPPSHREAVGLLAEMYASYRLEFLRVWRAHDRAPLAFAPYDAPAPDPALVVVEPGLLADLRANPLPG